MWAEYVSYSRLSAAQNDDGVFVFFFVYKTKPNPFQHDTVKLRLSLICWMQLILTLNSFSSCVIITVTGMNLKSPTTNTHKHSGGVRSLRRNNTRGHTHTRTQPLPSTTRSRMFAAVAGKQQRVVSPHLIESLCQPVVYSC